MEDKFQVLNNGQSIVQADFNQLGSYALMDDHVFAELIRMAPYDGVDVSKAILPYGVPALLTGDRATVIRNGATGSVLVRPFRAFVGSRTDEATNAKDNWRDVKSAIWLGSSTSQTAALTLAANASGNPRWDLVYAVVTPDADTATVSRKVKNTTTKVIAATSVVTTVVTTVAVAVQAGTPGALPVFPTIPADGAGAYNIPLAYVRVPNGFNGTSTVARTDIVCAIPMASIEAGGSSSLAPATYMFKAGGAPSALGGLTPAREGAWGATGTRPGWFMPPDLAAGPSRLLAFDLSSGTSTNWSHQSGCILDLSTNWSRRLFKWTMMVASNASPYEVFAFDPAAADPGLSIPNARQNSLDAGGVLVTGMGQSFIDDASGFGDTLIAHLDSTQCAALVGGTSVQIRCQQATGRMSLVVTGVPLCQVFIWLESTSQFSNYK